MNLRFNAALAEGYKSKSQKIRVMSEHWICENMFCPCCGNLHIISLKNNEPVADMRCNNCGEIFELKSKMGKIGKKINDGAYDTMIKRITSITNPDLFIMRYSSDLEILDLTIVPKFFFVPHIIERRKPLAPTAQRAGWIGCNILYSEIPKQGKISIIKNGTMKSSQEIVENYAKIKKLNTENIDARGWLMDVLNCVNDIGSDEFSLQEMYYYVKILQNQHRDNHNTEAKIRQQLQLLRDRGIIEFLGKGYYRKL